MTRTTKTSTRGSPLPDLESMGLAKKMKPLAALIDEQAKLLQRAKEVGRERQTLEEEIKRLEHARTVEWGRRLRAGEEEPSGEEIEKAKTRLEAVNREISAVRHAGELASAELEATVLEHAAEWDLLVQERGAKLLREAEEKASDLAATFAATEDLAALHGWLQSGARSWAPPTPASISLESVLHERRRDLGLLDAGILG